MYLQCTSKLKTNAEFEAKQIILWVFGFSLTDFILKGNEKAATDKIKQALDAVEKRNNYIPLYYILGECEFYSLKFKVGQGVLIPRQDTETLVEKALSLIEGKQNPKVVDLCSGSGCIAIAIAKNRPDAVVTAVELYDSALYYLKENVKLSSADNVTVLQADALKFSGEFDLVVSNPPYISQYEKDLLNREVYFEPKNALFADDNGLCFYKKICENFKGYSNFKIAFEIGFNQGEKVYEILKENDFKNIKIFKDLTENDRVVLGEK